MFLRQNIRSNFCAVYATAMLLSLSGWDISREAAMEVFRAKRKGWRGATHGDISRAIASINQSLRTQWYYSNPRTPVGLYRVIRRHWNGHPLLITAFCFHPQYDVADWHAFIIVAVGERRLAILDSLSRAPLLGRLGNAEFSADAHCRGRCVEVSGARWKIDLSRPLSIMVMNEFK